MYPSHLPPPRRKRTFLALLAVVFLAETAAMLLVDRLFPQAGPADWREILVDASTLVILSGPFVWWLAIRPIRRALHHEYRFAEALMNNPAALVVILDRAGRIVWFNPGCELVSGYSVDEVVGRDLFALLLPEEQRAEARERFSGCFTGQCPSHLQYMLQTASGAHRWIAWTHDTLTDQRGRIEYVVANGVDITEQRRQQVQLEQTDEQLRALIEATGQSAMLLDANGTVQMLNNMAALRLGEPPESMLGRNLYDFIPPDLAESRRHCIEQVIANPNPVSFEDVRGGLRLHHTLVPVRSPSGQVTQVAAFSEDVTESTLLKHIDALLHAFDQQVLAGKSLPEILEEVCAQLVRRFDYQAVWVGRKRGGGRVQVLCVAGPGGDYVRAIDAIGVRWDESPAGQGPAGRTIRSGRSQLCVRSDEPSAPWAEVAGNYGINTVLSLPLVVHGEFFGALLLCAAEAEAFARQQTVDLLRQIGERLNVVLEMAEQQQQMQLLRQAINTAGSGILVTNLDGTIEWTNRALRDMTGFSEQELTGETPRVFKSGVQDDAFYQQFWQTVLAGETWRGEVVNRRKDGTQLTVMQTVAPVCDSLGEITHFISVVEDISERKRAEERIRHLAEHDALTGLPNRVLMRNRLVQMLREKRRPVPLVGVLYLDVDRFKRINDEHGHDVGDALLRGFAERLTGAVRTEDTVARIGGDEFVVLLPRMHADEDVINVAEKILQVLKEPIDCVGHALSVGSSIGIAQAPAHGGDAATLLKRADLAMYAAKEGGRNTWRLFDESMQPDRSASESTL